MKKGWEIKKLGEVCEFENGDRGENYPSKSHRSETGVPFINAGHLTSFGLDINNMDYISRERFNLLRSGKIKKEDILFCLRGSLGKFAKVNEFSEGAIASSLIIVRPKSKIITNFLALYFESKICSDMIADFRNGTAQPNLSANSLKNFLIPIPPLSEQQEIVNILDKAFEAINKAKANAEKNLKNAKELFESYLQNVFENKGEDWEEKKLGEVCKVERGSSPRPIDKYFTDNEEGVNWIKIGDTKEVDKYIYSTKQKITKEGALQSRFVDVGDFILSNSMSFGKPYIMKTQGYIHDGWFVFRLPKNIDTEFFWYLLTSPYTMKQFISLATGSIVRNISGDLVKKTILPIPPLSKQQEIVAKLDALSAETKRLEVIYKQKINDLEELKKSILQKAFNGELI